MGYGFLTFKLQDSIEKALADGYIRVGLKDFELKQNGFIPTHVTPKYRKTGFSGFYNIEELRANKAKAQQEAATAAVTAARQKDESHSSSPVTGETTAATISTGTEFVSAFSPSTTTTTAATKNLQGNSTSLNQGANKSNENDKSSTSQPSLNHLQNKGLAQLWKTIPAEIQRAEQTAKSSEEGKEPEEDTLAIPTAIQ